jgi:hypothetical protein
MFVECPVSRQWREKYAVDLGLADVYLEKPKKGSLAAR